MRVAQLAQASSDPEIPFSRSTRPKFHHRCTNDRIREGSGRMASFPMATKISKNRKSMFKELGLDTDQPLGVVYSSEQDFTQLTGLRSPASARGVAGPSSDNGGNEANNAPEEQQKPQNSENEDETAETDDLVIEPPQQQPPTASPPPPPTTTAPASPTSPSLPPPSSQRPWYVRLARGPSRRPQIRAVSSAPPPRLSTAARLSALALLIALLLPGFSYFRGRPEAAPPLAAAAAAVAKEQASPSLSDYCRLIPPAAAAAAPGADGPGMLPVLGEMDGEADGVPAVCADGVYRSGH